MPIQQCCRQHGGVRADAGTRSHEDPNAHSVAGRAQAPALCPGKAALNHPRPSAARWCRSALEKLIKNTANTKKNKNKTTKSCFFPVLAKKRDAEQIGENKTKIKFTLDVEMAF